MGRWLAHDLNADKLAAKPFAHLPVLGGTGLVAGQRASGLLRRSQRVQGPSCGALMSGYSGFELEQVCHHTCRGQVKVNHITEIFACQP